MNGTKPVGGSVAGGEECNRLREEGNARHRANLPAIARVENGQRPLIVPVNRATNGFASAQNFAPERLYYAHPGGQ